MKLKLTACIDAPKEKIWQILSDISSIPLWVEPINSAYCEGDKEKGVGAVRVCHLKGNMEVREKWIQWDEGNSFTYEADETLYFKTAINKWSVMSEKGKTLLTTESEVILKGGFIGKLFEPLMYFISVKMGMRSMAALQYLAETGHPYKGKTSKLPKIAITC